MRPGVELTKVLITVMTYPHPSKKYQETVCTAGVTESGEWIRLYPIDYRYRPGHQKFKKWQWIEVALGERGHGSDQRVESREPDLIFVFDKPDAGQAGYTAFAGLDASRYILKKAK